MSKQKLFNLAITGTCFLALVACGKDSGKSSSNRQFREEVQKEEGIYRAVLSPIHTQNAEAIAGTVEIEIAGEEVIVKAKASNTPAGVKHFQNIMTGTECPNSSSDENQDGFVDAVEASQVSGKILIPLDSDLSHQMDGMDFGPIANSAGNYVYRRSTTLSQLLGDLNAEDPDKTDVLVKLNGKALNLSGRVILIHGVSSESALPESVAIVGDLSREQSLPIACGKIIRVNDEASLEESN
jgi:hypothetical protein